MPQRKPGIEWHHHARESQSQASHIAVFTRPCHSRSLRGVPPDERPERSTASPQTMHVNASSPFDVGPAIPTRNPSCPAPPVASVGPSRSVDKGSFGRRSLPLAPPGRNLPVGETSAVQPSPVRGVFNRPARPFPARPEWHRTGPSPPLPAPASRRATKLGDVPCRRRSVRLARRARPHRTRPPR